jgi:hypothetical protein
MELPETIGLPIIIEKVIVDFWLITAEFDGTHVPPKVFDSVKNNQSIIR